MHHILKTAKPKFSRARPIGAHEVALQVRRLMSKIIPHLDSGGMEGHLVSGQQSVQQSAQKSALLTTCEKHRS